MRARSRHPLGFETFPENSTPSIEPRCASTSPLDRHTPIRFLGGRRGDRALCNERRGRAHVPMFGEASSGGAIAVDVALAGHVGALESQCARAPDMSEIPRAGQVLGDTRQARRSVLGPIS